MYSVPQSPTPVDLYLDRNEAILPELLDFNQDMLLGKELFCKYPSAVYLESLIAGQLGIDADRVMITAGGDEAIDRACRISLNAERNIIMPSPTFCMYEHYTKLVGGKIKYINWNEPEFPIEQYIEAIDENTGSIVIVSPNNPTGFVAKCDHIRHIAKTAPHSLIIVDLAYEEFADVKLTSFVLEFPNCLVIRTYSKAWGLAGLRIGYAIGSSRVIQWLRKAGGPYSVSAFSSYFAGKVMHRISSTIPKYVESIKQSRDKIYNCLVQLGAEPALSQANFVFSRFKNAEWVYQGLAGLGIKVRAFPDMPELANALRITCPPDDQLDRLLHGLKTVMQPEAILLDLDSILTDVGETVYKRNRLGLCEKKRLLTSKSFLSWLRSYIRLGIITERPRKDAYGLLSEFDLLDIFDTVVCMENAASKPSPESIIKVLDNLKIKCAWMIGNTPDVIQTARMANILPLGIVPPGASAEMASQALLKTGAGKVLNSLDELKELLR